MTDPIKWLDSNGLVDGKIPAGTGCHMATSCKMREERCPTDDKPLEWPFSCALARLGSMVKLENGSKPRT